ncbi:hypothetical protein ABK040_005889 [Willaertia magna]
MNATVSQPRNTTSGTTTTTTVRVQTPSEVTHDHHGGKVYKFLKHAGIGALTLGLSRILIYAPISTQKTLIAISDAPTKEDQKVTDSEFTTRAKQYYEKPLLTKVLLYQASHVGLTYFLERQNIVPIQGYKPLAHALVAGCTFPLYYVLIDQESKLAIRRGREMNVVHAENDDSFWMGYAGHVLHSLLVHAVGLKVTQMLSGTDRATIQNASDHATANHDSSDARAVRVLRESIAIFVGRVLCLPLEIYVKQLLLKSKPKKDNYVNILLKHVILTAPQVGLGVLEYWLYRVLNRCID